MGNKPRIQKGELQDLPILARRFKPVSLLGSGAFGYVIKVQELKTRKAYALKTEAVRKIGPEKISLPNERDMLIELHQPHRHCHIVEFVEFFEVPRSPIPQYEAVYTGEAFSSDEPAASRPRGGPGPGSGRIPFACLVEEYCPGCDLSHWLAHAAGTRHDVNAHRRQDPDYDPDCEESDTERLSDLRESICAGAATRRQLRQGNSEVRRALSLRDHQRRFVNKLGLGSGSPTDDATTTTPDDDDSYRDALLNREGLLRLIVEWFIVLVRTFEFVHEKKKIVHRDLKTDNILVAFKSDAEAREAARRYRSVGAFEKRRPVGSGAAPAEDIVGHGGSSSAARGDGNTSQMTIEPVLKLADWGSARKLEEDHNWTCLGRDGVHMFFAAPEMLFGERYDTTVDVWSLGIVFFQALKLVPVPHFEAMIRFVFREIIEDPEAKAEIKKRFGIENLDESMLQILVLYFHKKDMLWHRVIKKWISVGENEGEEDSTAILEILRAMICDKEDRLTTTQLLNHKIVRTWEMIVCMLSDEDGIVLDFDDALSLAGGGSSGSASPLGPHPLIDGLETAEGMFNRRSMLLPSFRASKTVEIREDDISVAAVLTFLSRGELVGSCCTLLLVLDGYAECLTVGVLECLFRVVNMETWQPVSKLLVRMILKSPSPEAEASLIQRMCGLLRLHRQERNLMKMVLNRHDPFVFLFLHMLLEKNRTLRLSFRGCLLPLSMKFSTLNSTLLWSVCEQLVLAGATSMEAEQLLGPASGEDVLFLLAFDWEKEVPLPFVKTTAQRIAKLLREGTRVSDPSSVVRLLLNIVCIRPQVIHPMNLNDQHSPSKLCRFNYFHLGDGPLNVFIEDGPSNRTRIACGGAEPTVVDLISSEPIGYIGKDPRPVPVPEESDPLPSSISEEPGEDELELRLDASSSDEEDSEDENADTLADENGFVPVEGYFELTVRDGGAKDDLSLGFYIPCEAEELKIVFNCVSGTLTVSRSEDDVLLTLEILPGGVPACSGDVVGVGITLSGSIFVTKNNSLLIDRPFVDLALFVPPEDGIPSLVPKRQKMYALVRICGNQGFRADACVSSFAFQFANYGSVRPYVADERHYRSRLAIVKAALNVELVSSLMHPVDRTKTPDGPTRLLVHAFIDVFRSGNVSLDPRIAATLQDEHTKKGFFWSSKVKKLHSLIREDFSRMASLFEAFLDIPAMGAVAESFFEEGTGGVFTSV